MDNSVRPRSLSTRLAFSFAWAKYRGHYVLLSMIMLTFLAAWILLEIVVVAGQHYGWVWWAAMHLLFFKVFAGLDVGFLQICLAIHAGQEASFRDVFSRLDSGAKFLAGRVLFWAMVLVGLALCILPGVHLSTRFLLAGFCLIPREAGERSSFQRRAILSQSGEWELFILVLLIVNLNLVGASLVGLGLLVTVPISTLAMASAFRRLVGTASPSF